MRLSEAECFLMYMNIFLVQVHSCICCTSTAIAVLKSSVGAAAGIIVGGVERGPGTLTELGLRPR